MHTPRRSPRIALFALLVSGCSINSLLNKSEDETEETVDLVCSCSNVFPDRAMCEAQFQSLFSFVDRDCLEDALAVDKDASKDTLDCVVDQQKEYNSCLKKSLDCNDPTSFEGCQPLLDFEKCPQLPEAVQTELNACGSGT